MTWGEFREKLKPYDVEVTFYLPTGVAFTREVNGAKRHIVLFPQTADSPMDPRDISRILQRFCIPEVLFYDQ